MKRPFESVDGGRRTPGGSESGRPLFRYNLEFCNFALCFAQYHFMKAAIFLLAAALASAVRPLLSVSSPALANAPSSHPGRALAVDASANSGHATRNSDVRQELGNRQPLCGSGDAVCNQGHRLR